MTQKGRGPPLGKILVILVIVAAVVFGAYVGYLGFANQGFPVEERPFRDYATMVSPPQFNATEISFHVGWLNSSYIPVKAQITSDTTDAANSPACYFDLQTITAGQVIAMPFGLGSATATINNLRLSIDVRTLSTGHEFTIVYTVNSTSATNGDVSPTNVSCQETNTVM